MGLRDGTLFLLLRLHESPDPDENKPELPLAPGIPSLTNFNTGQSLIHRNMPKAKCNSNKSKTRSGTKCQTGSEEGADSELLMSLLPLRRVFAPPRLGNPQFTTDPSKQTAAKVSSGPGCLWPPEA